MFLKLRQTLEMIKFSHSIFALPFALSSMLLARGGLPSTKTVLLIIAAMVTARSAAMAFNRLVDAKIDAKNPRTASRHIPAGLLSKEFVGLFFAVNVAFFIGISAFFNQLTFYLSPIALFILCFYSLTKRFTHFTQLFLGVALGISPMAAWIAVTGKLALAPGLMGLGVMFWVAGFDILYALQDYEFDKKSQLKSLVVKLGPSNALTAARVFHIISIGFFVGMGFWAELGIIYTITVLLIAAFLTWEHVLIKPNDLSRINAAFFTMNGLVSLCYLAGMTFDLLTF